MLHRNLYEFKIICGITMSTKILKLNHDPNGVENFLRQHSVKRKADLIRSVGIKKYRRLIPMLQQKYGEINWNLPSLDDRSFLDSISIELGFKKFDDLFELKTEWIKNSGGSSYLHLHNQNMFELTKHVYPEYPWRVFDRHKVGRNIWKQSEFNLEFLDHTGKQTNKSTFMDWYQDSTEDFKKLNRFMEVNEFSSLFEVFNSCYPLFSWNPWSFLRVSDHFWLNESNVRSYLDSTFFCSSIRTIQNTYDIDVNDDSSIDPESGKTLNPSIRIHDSLLKIYKGSLSKLVENVYPFFLWEPWRFTKQPKNLWNNKENTFNRNLQHRLLQISDDLEHTSLDDWYRVSNKQMKLLKAYGCVKSMGSLFKALQSAFPWKNWEKNKFNHVKKSSQRWLYLKLKSILPVGTNIIEDYLYYYTTKSEVMKRPMIEFDIWLPDYRISIEYQGEHHYDLIRSKMIQESYAIKDDEKKRICVDNNIQLIEIPYWWDGRVPSLASTLAPFFPADVIPRSLYENVAPIPPKPLTRPSTQHVSNEVQWYSPSISVSCARRPRADRFKRYKQIPEDIHTSSLNRQDDGIYHCAVEHCKYDTKTYVNMEKHLNFCHKVKVYGCKQCGSMFVQEHLLHSHWKNHSNDKCYVDNKL
eukprot:TRINITY_DN1008_c0_g3_i1.p1 TRINITY_DN1008_c0_g3~~TRINITY_DN1008_c0_g3_i1.p1  ORF type:complete len:638 (-),score=58.48 TRINITY_DN1008_c0_g3_i1:11-1924(-)